MTRGPALFALINSVAVNMGLSWAWHSATTLQYTRSFFAGEAYNDSWRPMREALSHPA